ncbi:uncharacterized protein [Diadema setosum]|uniref:uncharacterized protein n=1 Tax=Diadema setosum TaxID=31175 RepID=UPI003B3BB67F
MERRYALVLLLALTASVFSGTAAEASAVGTAPNVRGWKGEDIRLRCDIQEEPLAVFWFKESESDQQPPTIKAAFIGGNFESREERFDIDKNFSLVITTLEVADEGLYHCDVVLTNRDDFTNSTFLTVDSIASKHVIEECVDESKSNKSRCTYQTSSNTPSVNLTCVVSEFKPNISVLWSKETGEILNSTVSHQTTLSDDTYERFEAITVFVHDGTEETFICVATGDPLNGISTAEVTVLSPSEKHGNMGLVIGLAIGVPVALAILFLLVGIFLQKYHPEYLPRNGCSWNPCWRLNTTQRSDVEGLMMESVNPAMTKKQVKRCKEDLKAYYRKTRRKVTVDPLNFMERLNLDDIYTNLSLIDISSNQKRPLSYKDLLTNEGNSNLSKRLLIKGDGGAGKTTLCAKIAWDWCQGKILQDLDMVILVPLRDVIDVNKSIGSIVERYLSDSNETTPNLIDDYISKNLHNVLLLFDGFDEFSGNLEHGSSSDVIRILVSEQYKSCKVIVTSRPWRIHEFTLTKSLADDYTFINVEGFKKEDLSTYIRKYFYSRKKGAVAENLISFIEENDVIRSNMAPFPIYCAMLCLMWEEFSEERRREMMKMQTFSEIFGAMISFLKEHYASKSCGSLQKQDVVEKVREASKAIQDVSEIALNGLLDRHFSFPEEQFRECGDAMQTCVMVGVLTTEKKVIGRERRQRANTSYFVESTVLFPHKLFQEYTAGVYITNLFSKDRPKYDHLKYKLLPRSQEFRYLLYFASALKKELGLDIIHGLIKEGNQDLCIDVAFECHTEEAISAVEKLRKEYTLSPNSSEHTNLGVAFMVHWDKVQSLSIQDMTCGRTTSHELAESICSSRVLKHLRIIHSEFHRDFFKILGASDSNCEIQNLKLSFEDAQWQSSMEGDVTKWISSMPRLTSFRVKCCYFELQGGKTATMTDDLKLHFQSSDRYFRYHSSMGGELARWVCTLPSLSSFTLTCDFWPEKFFSTAVDSASSCEIQNLNLSIEDSQYHSSMEGDLTKWISSMPRLSSIRMKCGYFEFQGGKTDTMTDDLKLHFQSSARDFQYHSSMGGELARWVCTLQSLSSFTLTCDFWPEKFFSTAVDSASSCEIQNLNLSIDDSQYHSSMEGDLTKWISSMPRLSSFRVKCGYFEFQGGKTDTMTDDLKLHFQSSARDFQYHSSMGGELARWVCTLQSLSSFTLTCDFWPEKFFSTAVDSASSCEIQNLNLSIEDSQYHSSMEGDLTKWISSMPRLSSFRVKCGYFEFQGGKTDTMTDDLKLHFQSSARDFQYHSSMGGELARWVCTLQSLSSFTLTCDFWPEKFFSTAVDSASSCEIQNLNLSVEDSQCHSSMEGDLTKLWISSMTRLSSFRVKCCYFEFQGGNTDTIIDNLTLHFQSSDKDCKYHSSIGGDLARWVCTLPRLRTFSLTCDFWPEKFFSTAADPASSCQIYYLMLHFQSSDKDCKYHSSMGGDLARWVCTLPRLRTFSLTCDFWPEKFFSTVADSASSCQIEDLTLHFQSSDKNCKYHSSMGGDLARWVCTLPRLRTFNLTCDFWPEKFFSTAADSASSCQISELTLHFQSSDKNCKYHSSMGGDLARWVCTLPRLRTFNLTCDIWPEKFFSTAAYLASSCQISELTLHFQSSDKNCKYHSSMGGDLARWVCALPRLRTFNLTCDFWPEKFISTAAYSASSCQIEDLTLHFQSSDKNCKYHSSMGEGLARWVCTLPYLWIFTLTCNFWPDKFFSTAAYLASSLQIRKLKMMSHQSWESMPAASANLAEFLCRLPVLKRADLNFHNLPDIFFATMESHDTRNKAKGITIGGKPLRELLADYQGRKALE